MHVFSIVAYNPVFEVTFKDGVLYENGKAIDQDPSNTWTK